MLRALNRSSPWLTLLHTHRTALLFADSSVWIPEFSSVFARPLVVWSWISCISLSPNSKPLFSKLSASEQSHPGLVELVGHGSSWDIVPWSFLCSTFSICSSPSALLHHLLIISLTVSAVSVHSPQFVLSNAVCPHKYPAVVLLALFCSFIVHYVLHSLWLWCCSLIWLCKWSLPCKESYSDWVEMIHLENCCFQGNDDNDLISVAAKSHLICLSIYLLVLKIGVWFSFCVCDENELFLPWGFFIFRMACSFRAKHRPLWTLLFIIKTLWRKKKSPEHHWNIYSARILLQIFTTEGSLYNIHWC